MPVGSGSQGRSRGGCLTGCLVTILLTLLLTVALVLGGYFAGKRYIEANLPAWEAEYPVLGVLTTLLSFDKEDPFKDLRPGERSRVEGSSDPGMVPSDIPLFDPAVRSSTSVSESHTTIYQEIAGTAQQTYREALRRFHDRGWRCELAGEGAAICNKAEQTCSLRVTDPPAFLFQPVQIAEVWISCSHRAAGVTHE